GRMLIPFLRPDCYYGVEPNLALLDAGVRNEIGWEAFEVKRPIILPVSDFSLWRFGTKFDFVMAHSIFTHTQPALAAHALRAVREVLAPGGKFVGTFIAGDPAQRPPGGTWISPDCIPYATDETHELLARAGLRVLPMRYPHPCQEWWIASGDQPAE
ncbi:MAG: class I SAM-dependent methyltransferase, partial [Deltaproteobacteria bacterium]|nr:class I SAM-dependent methyltransferase [Deltaproteobacteria bacterium]